MTPPPSRGWWLCTGLKDLIDCKFTINPKYVEASASATEVSVGVMGGHGMQCS